MRISEFGKELIFLWEGNIGVNDIKLTEVPSTLQISEDMKYEIGEFWAEFKTKNPNAFSRYGGMSWRTEYVLDRGGELEILVSPINYSQHNVMRHEKGKNMGFYPNPITINTLQETDDGYLLLGVKGKTSDQKGLGLIGAGFVEREEGKPSETIAHRVYQECIEETAYHNRSEPKIGVARAISVLFGSNHDSTVAVYLPINATSKEVGLKGSEHNDLLLLPANEIGEVLEDGGYKGVPASDHVLGSLESYLRVKE